jgi:hypothetical protein
MAAALSGKGRHALCPAALARCPGPHLCGAPFCARNSLSLFSITCRLNFCSRSTSRWWQKLFTGPALL